MIVLEPLTPTRPCRPVRRATEYRSGGLQFGVRVYPGLIHQAKISNRLACDTNFTNCVFPIVIFTVIEVAKEVNKTNLSTTTLLTNKLDDTP